MELASLEPRRVPGVRGDLRVVRGWRSEALGRALDLSVWLPDGWDGRPLGVVYFLDGHNLYDPDESAYGGVWHADRALSAHGGLIGVGLPCHPTERLEEYSPYLVPEAARRMPGLGPARGAAMLDCLVGELKPVVDEHLATRRGPESTAIVGSSAGGVMSLWAWSQRPDVFGLAGVVSPALWLAGTELLDDAARACRAGTTGRLHVDVGGREAHGPTDSRRYVEAVDELVRLLRTDPRVALRYEYCSEADHSEAAWAARLPGVLAHLFPTDDTPIPAGWARETKPEE